MVSRFLRNFTRSGAEPYRLQRLVDNRILDEVAGPQHIICDIDKTYLETEFESVVRMARIAFESAADKITVAGASAVLRALRWGDLNGGDDAGIDPGAEASLGSASRWPRPLHFVSSSPPQLRPVLEEKLTMDKVDWTSDTFKDQAYNLIMGRMDLLRHHIAYKSLAILNLIARSEPHTRFSLLGDNAESDAFIYLGVKLIAERLVSFESYGSYLEIAGVEPEVTSELLAAIKNLPIAHVDHILIRNVPGYSLEREPPFTNVIQSFDNFYQAALIFMVGGLIPPSLMWKMTRTFHNQCGLSLGQISGAIKGCLETPGLPPSLTANMQQMIATLNVKPDSEALLSMKTALNQENATSLKELKESEILHFARNWKQRMRRERS